MPFEPAAIADLVENIIRTAVAPIVARVKALESQPQGVVTALSDRVASLEAKAAQPGPPGPEGPPGKNGADGLSMQGYTVDYDGERTFTHKWSQGTKTVTLPIKTPLAIYRGVWLDGKNYERGDLVTVSGSIYHANRDTSRRPGDGSTDWTLAVKRGRDDRLGH